MGPVAEGYADAWVGQPLRSDDPAYVRAYEEGTCDRALADRRPKINPRFPEGRASPRRDDPGTGGLSRAGCGGGFKAAIRALATRSPNTARRRPPSPSTTAKTMPKTTRTSSITIALRRAKPDAYCAGCSPRGSPRSWTPAR